MIVSKNSVIIRFTQFDGVRSELLEHAVIHVEELEGVAAVTRASQVSSSEVLRKFSSIKSLEDEATCSMASLSTAPDIIRSPSSTKMSSTTSLCETLQCARPNHAKLASLARRPCASSAELHSTNPLVLRVPRRSLRSPSVSKQMSKNWSTSISLEWHVANLTLAGSKKPRSASEIRQVCEGRLLHHPDLHATSDWKPPRSRQHFGALSSTVTRQSQARQRPREGTRRSLSRNSIGPTREFPWRGFMWMISL